MSTARKLKLHLGERELQMQAKLVKNLQSPICFPHKVEKIEVIETHISWVILTGKYAYKIKKSLDLGFLNFSNLDLRRYFCEEELRLNKRFSPALYLDVIPITGDFEAPEINGNGEILEYAVLMGEFPRAMLFSHLLKRGELDRDLIKKAAVNLSAFHERAEACQVSEETYMQALEDSVRENFKQIRGLGVFSQEEDAQLSHLENWTENQLKSLNAFFRQRYQNAKVRECHGDLHLENITLIDQQPVFFDCIEFSSALRNIDVFSELAFLIMDLEYFGKTALSNNLLNHYLNFSGDFSGLKCLRFFKVYRAMVRAKVNRIRQEQEDLSEATKLKLYSQFVTYLQLANRFTSGENPSLSITCGFSGSGKSSHCKKLSEGTGALHIRSDVERKRLFGLKPNQSSGSAINKGIYTEKANQHTYAELLSLARFVLEAGYPLIVDATFLERKNRLAFLNLAREYAINFQILYCQASPAEIERRLMQRKKRSQSQNKVQSTSEADIDVYQHQLEKFEAFSEEELCFVTEVGTGDTVT